MSTILVCCLCAEWCSSCRDYKGTFFAVGQDYPDARFLWIDIEDQPEMVGDIGVEDFPTVMIANGTEPRFFGPVTPQREVLMRLVDAHWNDFEGTAISDRELWALAARLRAAAP